MAKRIKGIQFGLSNPKDILNFSVCQVNRIDLYERNKPKSNGLFDTRMGVIVPGLKCATCSKTSFTCQGHFGHIELVEPVYLPHFLKTILRILQIVCTHCSCIINHATNIRTINPKTNILRLVMHYNVFKERSKCPKCEYIQPKWSKDNLKIFYTDSNGKHGLSAKRCHEILSKISNEELLLLGFDPLYSRPEWSIFTILPVGPPCIRPTVFHDGGLRSESDLTYKYIDIIKCNNMLQAEYDRIKTDLERFDEKEPNADPERRKSFIEKKQRILETRYEHLQIHITTMINNKLSNVAKSHNRSNRPFKGLVENLGGKRGRVRGNLMGKRVNYSARSVITPDPTLSITELGVPFEIATELTMLETANRYNLHTLQKYIDNGPDKYPGALFIIRNENRHSLKTIKKSLNQCPSDQLLLGLLVLQIGDKIERHLVDGDHVLFNRQPSLHKASMMSHIVRVLPYQTLRINPNVCTPYNADFDGDEMNMHTPRSIQTSIELSELVAVKHQIVSAQACKPLIGCIQDSLLGLFRITRDDITILHEDLVNFLAHIRKSNRPKIPSIKTFTGKQVVSLFFPENLHYESGDVIIKKGLLISGQITKKHMGPSSGSIVQVIWNDYGADACVNFIDSLSILVNRWNITQGFSVGLSDAIMDSQTRRNIQEEISRSKTIVYQKNENYYQNASQFENSVLNLLNNTRDKVGSIATKQVFRNNRIKQMVTAGSKGSPLNISQIMGLVGQQVVKGTDGSTGRVKNGFIDRSFVHCPKYSLEPKMLGFVGNSYLSGLDPIEFFCHSMSGREGLIDTAIKTSSTGYLQRKLIKGMESISISTGNYVKLDSDQIVQFLYGGDSLDGQHLERTSIKRINIEDYIIPNENQDAELESLSKLVYPGSSVHVPFNIHRLLQQTFMTRTKSKCSYSKMYLGLEKLISRLSINHIIDKTTDKYYLRNVEYVLRTELAPRKLLDNYTFTQAEYNKVLEQVYQKYNKAIVEPGECVGPLAAQSIGESLTQLSVVRDTKVIVNVNGEIKLVEIGSFIDELMNKYNKNVIMTHITEDGKKSSILDIPKKWNITVPGVRPDEKVIFGNVTQVSRHPVNGGLVTVTTRSGRIITCTLSHSLLTRENNTIVPIKGSDVKIGTIVPIISNLNIQEINTLNILQFLLSERIIVENNLVYSKNRNHGKNTLDTFGIPINIILNYSFGCFIGQILSDCHIGKNNNTITMMNTEYSFIEKTKKFCDNFGIAYKEKIDSNKRGFGTDNKPVHCIVISSRVLNDLVKCWCGSTYKDKHVPEWALNAPKEFLKGLLSLYFDGDGNVSNGKNQRNIRAHSSSKELLDGIGLLLTRFGIITRIALQRPELYEINILSKHSSIFAREIGFTTNYKMVALDLLIFEQSMTKRTDHIDKITNMGHVLHDTAVKLELMHHLGANVRKDSIGRESLKSWIPIIESKAKHMNIDIFNELEILNQSVNSDILWDTIIDIKYSTGSEEYVYDFSVQDIESFSTAHGLLVHNTLNTFHSAGIASETQVTAGIPRFSELINVSKNPQNTTIKIPGKTCVNPYLNMTRVIESAELFYESGWTIEINIKSEYLHDTCLIAIAFDNYYNVDILLTDSKIILSPKEYTQESQGVMTDILENFDNIIIYGIPGITSTCYSDGITSIVGGRLEQLISLPDIDFSQAISNNVVNVFEILGIEAARKVLFDELLLLLEQNGVSINARHTELLVDTIAHSSILIAMDRHGSRKSTSGVLAAASFEEVMDTFARAGIHSQYDNLVGVTPDIMLGQLGKFGTGLSQVAIKLQE